MPLDFGMATHDGTRAPGARQESVIHGKPAARAQIRTTSGAAGDPNRIATGKTRGARATREIWLLSVRSNGFNWQSHFMQVH